MPKTWATLVVAVGLASPLVGAEVLRPQAGARWIEVQLEGGTLQARALQACQRFSLTIKGPGTYWKRHVFGCETPGVAELDQPGSPAAPGTYTWEARVLGLSDVPRVSWGRFAIATQEETPPEEGAPVRQPTADLTIADPTPQLVFDDTDAGATDWQAASNANGAQFVVQNTTAGTTPVTVLAAAPNNALVVSNSGIFAELGVGTATPAGPGIHLVGANSSSVTLDFTQAGDPWTVFGAASDFAVSSTNSRVFGIEQGAPGRSLHIDTTGNVASFADNGGILNGNIAGASLHVKRSNGTARLMVEEASTTTAGRNLARFVNNGAATFRFDNTAAGGVSWGFGSRQAGDFFVSSLGAPAVQMSLNTAGNLAITGTLSQGSDRNTKDDIQPLDPAGVLEKLAGLPLASWRYKGDPAVHAGPMAQDFHQAFGLGADDKHIAPGDMAGLGLAAIQALVRQNDDLRAELGLLRERVAQLEGGTPQAGDGTRR